MIQHGLPTVRMHNNKSINASWKSPSLICTSCDISSRTWSVCCMFKCIHTIRQLTTRRAISMYKIYGDSALLVLNGTSFNSVNAPLALCRHYGIHQLTTRRAIYMYKVYGDSALLVLNGTSFNSVNAPLALCRHYGIHQLTTRRAIYMYKVYGDSALLVLNGTSLKSFNALLALNRRHYVCCALERVMVLQMWEPFVENYYNH